MLRRTTNQLMLAMAVMGFAPPAAASTTPFVTQSVELRGRMASHAMVAELRDGGGAELRAHLGWSDLVDADVSAVTVEVDGVAQHTARLRDLDDGELRTTLLVSGDGYHEVKLVTRLRAHHEERCALIYDREIWLRIDPQSVVEGPATSTPGSAAVRDITTVLGAPGETVFVSPPSEQTPETLEAVLAADWWLRSFARQPELSVQAREGAGVRLRLSESLPADVGATLSLEGDQLEIIAADGEALVAAMEALRGGASLAACGEPTCWLPRDRPARAAPTATAPREGLPLFADTRSEGWTGRGPGTHTFEASIHRPAHWEVSGQAEVRLRARWYSNHAPTQSRVTISVNDTPLGTWPLDSGSGEAQLAARLPRALADAPTLNVEVHAHLVDADDCTAGDPRSTWIHLDADSEVWLPRIEHQYEGLPRFVREARAEGVHIVPPQRWTWPQVALLAAALARVESRGGLPAGATLSRDDDALRVAFGSTEAAGDAAQLELTPASGRIRARETRWQLPLMRPSDVGVLVVRGRELWLEASDALAPSAFAPPALDELRSLAALWTGERWQGVGPDAAEVAQREVVDEAAAMAETLAAPPSEESRLRAFVDLALVFALTLGLGVLLFLRWRGRGAAA